MIRFKSARRSLASFALFVLVSLKAVSAQTAPSVQVDTEPARSSPAATPDYCAGPDDLLSVSVLEAPDLSRSVRVSASGEISLPLIGAFRVSGLSPRAIEFMVQDRLRETYMRDPQVSVQVLEIQSHPISVMGAVNKPGTFQIRGARTLLEVLSLAEGLAPGAGDTAIVMRGTAAAPRPVSDASTTPNAAADTSSVEVQLKPLLQAKDPRQNILVYPGDIVKVMSAGLVYLVGDVNKPGAFPMQDHEKLTILNALALGEGLKPTAAGKKARLIRISDTGARQEVAVNLSDILKGKAPDLSLQARDIVFVPNSRSKAVAFGTADALVRMVTLRGVLP